MADRVVEELDEAESRPMADFEAVAPRYPVFRISSAPVVLVETILPG